MILQAITIEWEENGNTFKATFGGGCWTLDKPIPSRFCGALHEIWKILRACNSDKDKGGPAC